MQETWEVRILKFHQELELDSQQSMDKMPVAASNHGHKSLSRQPRTPYTMKLLLLTSPLVKNYSILKCLTLQKDWNKRFFSLKHRQIWVFYPKMKPKLIKWNLTRSSLWIVSFRLTIKVLLLPRFVWLSNGFTPNSVCYRTCLNKLKPNFKVMSNS